MYESCPKYKQLTLTVLLLESHHVTVRKQLVQRLSGLLDLHGDGDPLLLRQRAVKCHHLLDHLHLFISVPALGTFSVSSLLVFFIRKRINDSSDMSAEPVQSHYSTSVL